MAFRVNHLNKKTGVTYVYEAVSVWDKEKKQSRNKQVCIGKIEPGKNEFVPSKRLNPEQAAIRDPNVTVTAKVVGPSLLLNRITNEYNLDKLLKSISPKNYNQILSMVYYLVIQGGPLSHCETWSKAFSHPYELSLSSQRISDIIKSINEDQRQSFLKAWSKNIYENDYLCYDITSISSYSELNEYVKYGYNRDGEKLKQINLAMLFGQNSRLPVYYHRLPGNIGDVSTLKNLIKTLNLLDFSRIHIIMDKGFYSKKNIDALLEKRNHFTIAVPIHNKWLKETIDKYRETMYGPKGYKKIDDEILYVHTSLKYWGDKRYRCYVHQYYNAHIAADQYDSFTEELLTYKEELESGKRVAVHEDAYKEYFIIKETPARGLKVIYNDEAIEKHRNKYSGFFSILSNVTKDAVEALHIYRDKDAVEKSFDDLKNQLDMKRLRIHSSATMDGRLFIQFIALIYMSVIRNKMRKTKLNQKYSVREILQELSSITEIKYSGKYGKTLTEISKSQREIFDKFEIKLDA
jgi:transposase